VFPGEGQPDLTLPQALGSLERGNAVRLRLQNGKEMSGLLSEGFEEGDSVVLLRPHSEAFSADEIRVPFRDVAGVSEVQSPGVLAVGVIVLFGTIVAIALSDVFGDTGDMF
jgi:hypothetical protein